MAIDCHQRLDDEGDEAQVVERRLAWAVKQYAGIGGEAPVAVLAAAVNARKGLFVEEQTEAVLACHFLHQAHDEHVVIDSKVRLFVDRCKLELIGSHLVVARFAGNAKLQGFHFQILHKGGDTHRDGAKVVVVHLLVLRTIVTEERAPCHKQIGACCIESFIDKEVFLLPAEIADDLLDVGIEITCHLRCRLIDGLERFLEGRLVVKGFAGIRNEDGGNHQGVAEDEDRACRVPCTIATRLKRGAYASAGERTGIRLLLHELLAGKLFYHATLAIVLYKTVVLLGRAFGERLEPMSAMRCPQFHRPLLHAGSHSIGSCHVEHRLALDDVAHLLINISRQVLLHLLPVENVFGKEFAGTFLAGWHFDGLLAESLAYYLKPERTGHLFYLRFDDFRFIIYVIS